MTRTLTQTAVFLACTLLAVDALAGEERQEGAEREHRGPPEVALEACQSAVQGDPCSFAGRQGEALDGTCEAPDDKPLACRPDNKPDKPRLKNE